MKTPLTQKEILLITGTSFAEREWNKKNMLALQHGISAHERETLFWNNVLPEILPELPVTQNKEEKLSLWLVRHGQAYIQLELCEEPLIIEREFSLDPYLFLSAQIYN